LLKKTKDDFDRWKDSHIHTLEDIIVLSLQLVYSFNAVSIRIRAGVFVEIIKMILKFTWNCKGPRRDKIILKKYDHVDDSHAPISLQSKLVIKMEQQGLKDL
jgi:hypothetical protein